MSSQVESASSMVDHSASASVERTDLGMRTKTHLSRRAWKMASRVVPVYGNSWSSVAIGRLALTTPVQEDHSQDKRLDDVKRESRAQVK